ncbi:hypothetical protein AB0N88_12865 [Streptomyces sp. NPDC093516]|uniref:hypothetical protein n=1 Tax=Streptomyces sp. NPDC093516 TaxID=3155304 RepID=UPI00343841CE
MSVTGRSTRRTGAWVLCGLLPLLTALGCSSPDGDGSSQDGPPPIEVTRISDPANIEQPLNKYILTQRQTQLMFAAEQRLRTACAQRFGLSWEPPPVDLDVPDTFRYGADAYIRYDEDAARRHGYHAAAGSGERDAVDGGSTTGTAGDEPSGPRMSPQLRTVLTGQGSGTVGGRKVPDGGCVEEARRTLRKGTDPHWDENYPNSLAINLQGKIDEDPRVVKVLAKWSACMKQAGFDYARPKDAWADPRWEASDTPTAQERAVAVAEVRCGRTARVAETMAAVERAYQERVADDKSQELAEYDRGKEAVMRRVAELLGR